VSHDAASGRRDRAVALSITAALYGLLTIPLALWPARSPGMHVAALCLYGPLALGLAVEACELMLGLLWSRPRPAAWGGVPAAGRTAVVMTVCNDADDAALAALLPLADAGHDVFLLDDSTQPVELVPDLASRVTHVRRRSRDGAKAGNLNAWLFTRGTPYDFCVLLDSDSIVPPGAVLSLTRTAADPSNHDVAVFQAKVEPRLDPSASLLQRLLAPGARPRMWVLERVHARLGLLLSFGHNQLLHLGAVRAVGGFDVDLTSEDTVLALDLASRGWRTVLVDAWTYDTDPDDLHRYVARTTRWARQTVELFGREWRTAPLRLKLLLCRHLLSYLLPLCSVVLLGLSVWTGPATPAVALAFLRRALTLVDGYAMYGLALWPPLGLFGLTVALRVVLALREGVPARSILLASTLGRATQALLVLPLAVSMTASALGRRVRFLPTNERSGSAPLGPWTRARITLGAAVVLALLALGAALHPGSLIVGLNALWLGSLVISTAVVSVAVRAASGSVSGTRPTARRGSEAACRPQRERKVRAPTDTRRRRAGRR
jgi:cellulose synthase/poly-beta-1,6-N-acetylglucosamine synthase-like glycosyltransferase